MPAAVLVPALIGAGTSIASGVMGSGAAKGAAKDQSQTGINVAHQIEKSSGDAIAAGYQGIAQATTNLDQGLVGSNLSVGQGVNDANYALRQGQNDATYALADARNNSNTVQKEGYDKNVAAIAPYLAAGQQGVTGLQNMAAGKWDFKTDPGYEFRVQQGMKALGSSAAAHGGALGGDALKAAGRYGQDYASNEYGKVFERQSGILSALSKMGLDATQLNSAANNHYSDAVSSADLGTGAKVADVATGTAGRLADTSFKGGALESNNWNDWAAKRASVGLQGNEWIGEMGLRGSEAAGNAYMGAANARAAGDIASANAWSGMFNGLSQTASNVDWKKVFGG